MFSKNKKAVDMIVIHIDAVTKCIKDTGLGLEAYIEGNLAEAMELVLKADALALDANHKMGNIQDALRQGSVVAPIRENLYLLATNFNRVAVRAATCGLYYIDRRPEIPKSFRIVLNKLVETAFGGRTEIKKWGLSCLKSGWHSERNCELSAVFWNLQGEVKNIHRDLNNQISEMGEAPWQQVVLDTCSKEVIGVFEQMIRTAETITKIYLRFGS